MLNAFYLFGSQLMYTCADNYIVFNVVKESDKIDDDDEDDIIGPPPPTGDVSIYCNNNILLWGANFKS